MFGMIGKITATPGQRDALIAILADNRGHMPGCLSYVVSKDALPDHADVIWVSEAWTNADAHKASLQLPEVKTAIQKGRPLIAGFEVVATIEPVGGHGLVNGA